MATTYDLDIVIEPGETGMLVASVPALPGCFTQGATLDEVLTNIKEAIELCLETGEVPQPVTVQRISVAA